MDTIFSLATARGRAGVAVIRISGDYARQAAAQVMRDVPDKRGVRALLDAEGMLLDEALVLCFPSGRSFTGEEVVELHLHGSPAIVSAVLGVLGQDKKLRQAEAGEFTRRALDNGCLDLAQVEGLADLIDSETESQRKQALRVFSGALGELAERWRSMLIRAAALLEATIDFADEEVPVDVSPEVSTLLQTVMAEIKEQAAGVSVAERIRDGFEVVIIGAPNVGKSTLLNRLAGRDVAITSEIAGTTRDVIEVRMDLQGIPVTVLDTAGMRATDDVVEGLGVEKAIERAAQADVRVNLILDGALPDQDFEGGNLFVRAKSDVLQGEGLAVSGVTGEGVDQLIHIISGLLEDRVASVGVAIRERHRDAMMRGLRYLDAASELLKHESEIADIIAEELRSALRAVDSLVGRVDVEHVLDEIFSSFCIGK